MKYTVQNMSTYEVYSLILSCLPMKYTVLSYETTPSIHQLIIYALACDILLLGTKLSSTILAKMFCHFGIYSTGTVLMEKIKVTFGY